MGIRRVSNGLDSNFTTVPNSWVRDRRLTFKARGLLAMLLSHKVGWNITITSLASQNVEGKDAILSAVRELESFGYLKREGSRSSGKFDADWVLKDPPPAVEDNPPTVEDNPPTVADLPRRFNRDGSTATDNPPLKKNSNKKTSIKENQPKEESAPKGAHALPENWFPEQDTIQTIQAEHPTVNLEYEHKKFTDYWNGVRHLAKGRKTDWEATWRNWMRRVGEKQAQQNGYKPGWQKRLEYNAQLNNQYQDPVESFMRSIEQ